MATATRSSLRGGDSATADRDDHQCRVHPSGQRDGGPSNGAERTSLGLHRLPGSTSSKPRSRRQVDEITIWLGNDKRGSDPHRQQEQRRTCSARRRPRRLTARYLGTEIDSVDLTLKDDEEPPVLTIEVTDNNHRRRRGPNNRKAQPRLRKPPSVTRCQCFRTVRDIGRSELRDIGRGLTIHFRAHTEGVRAGHPDR